MARAEELDLKSVDCLDLHVKRLFGRRNHSGQIQDPRASSVIDLVALILERMYM